MGHQTFTNDLQYQPLRDIIRDAVSLRETGFAEAFEDDLFQCVGIAGSNKETAVHVARCSYNQCP